MIWDQVQRQVSPPPQDERKHRLKGATPAPHVQAVPWSGCLCSATTAESNSHAGTPHPTLESQSDVSSPSHQPLQPQPPTLAVPAHLSWRHIILLFFFLNNSKEIKLPSPFEQRLLSSPAWLSFLPEVHCPSLAHRTSGLPGGFPCCHPSQLLPHHLSAPPPVSLVSLIPQTGLSHRSALQALPPSCLCPKLDFLQQPWVRRAPLSLTQSGGVQIWSLLIWLS